MEQVEAADVGQTEVEQYEVRNEVIQLAERGAGIGGGHHEVARSLKTKPEHISNSAVVVDD